MIKIFKRLRIYLFIATLSLIAVVANAQTDASITGIDPANRLSAIPVYLADTITFTGKCTNAGVDTITNFKVTVEIYDNTSSLVYMDSSTYNDVAPASILNYSVGHFFTKVLGVYNIKGFVTADGAADADGSNDTSFATIAVTDSTMAHDYSAFAGINGTYTVNSGNPLAKMGNLFDISKAVNLTSIYFKLQNPANAGDTVRASIYEVDSLGKPTINLLAQTVIYTFTAADVANGVDLVLPVETNTILQPGTYMVAINEYQGSINLATTNRIYTPQTSFYLWPPLSQTVWQAIEVDGIFKSYVIEPNFGCKLQATGVTSDEICDNQNGTITANALFSSGNVSYLWSNGETTQTISDLTAGNYSLTIMDEAGCSSFAGFSLINVAGPVLDSTATTGTNCFGSNEGTATVFASGGTGVINYLWSNGETTSVINNLFAGSYTASITDQNGCTGQTTLAVIEPTQVVVTANSTGALCNGSSDGTVDATVTGGTGAYSYLWSTGDTDASVLNLISGTYSVTVSDANGCTASKSVNVTQPNAIQITPTITDAKCFGTSTGSISVSITGGTGNLDLLWSDGSTDASINNLAAGTYTVIVMDQNGCVEASTSLINEPNDIVVLLTATNTFCSSSSDGSVTSAVSGGTSPYSYLWSNGVTNADNMNLPVGTYTLTVTDANGCTKSRFIAVITPNPIIITTLSVTDATCYGGNNGNATVSASGGTGSIGYLWSTGSSNLFINNQPAGTYTVTATDQNGCSTSSAIVINQPAQIGLVTSFTNATCFGGNDGSVSVVASGGSPGYSYLWSTGDTTDTVINLSAATYFITVTDNNGCTSSKSVDVEQAGQIAVTCIPTNISCFGNVDGSISVSSIGGIGTVNYVWSNGSTDILLTNLQAAIYSVTVTDQNGCTSTATAIVTEPAQLLAFTSALNVACFGESSGAAYALVTGGTGNMSYLWSNGGTAASATNIPYGTYTVVVTDVNNCSASATALVTQPTQLLASTAFTADNGSSNGTATVSTTIGGTSPYTYSWNTVPVQTNITATGLAAATYTATITDANQCTITVTVVVPSSAGLHENAGLSEFMVSPNPANDVVFVNIKLNQQSDIKILITDMSGRAVYNEALNNTTILNKKISVETYSKGVYSLSVQTKSGIETKRLIIE